MLETYSGLARDRHVRNGFAEETQNIRSRFRLPAIAAIVESVNMKRTLASKLKSEIR